MFLDEARLSAQLSHSNCVQVFDIGVGDNAYFIVMEYVNGANLKTIAESLRKAGKEFPVQCAALIAVEICKGLSYAHELRDPNGVELKIVHRDMSPPNVLVTKYGEIKIVDFGLAKANSQLERSEPGIIKGKFSYLSPEAALGQEVDARTDIFAVGIILWELLSRPAVVPRRDRLPDGEEGPAGGGPAISQINKQVPPELEKIIVRSLARDPSVRYQTARELAQDLNKFMFRFAQPVSTFDIATLVNGAMRDRARMRPQQGSIIDKLIEEALLEFTSLKPEERGGRSPSGNKRAEMALSSASPLNPDQFVDPTELGERDLPRRHVRASGTIRCGASLPAEAFSEGNLSLLEDDGPMSPRTVRGPTPVAGPPVLPGPMRPRACRGAPNAKGLVGATATARGQSWELVVFWRRPRRSRRRGSRGLIPHH